VAVSIAFSTSERSDGNYIGMLSSVFQDTESDGIFQTDVTQSCGA